MYITNNHIHIRSSGKSECNAGEEREPYCTPAYAPPEIVRALPTMSPVMVSPAHDMWALGVMGFEAIVGSGARAMTTAPQLHRCAEGVEPYPWEAPVEQQPAPWRQARLLRGMLEPFLARKAGARPTAAALQASLESIGDVSSAAI